MTTDQIHISPDLLDQQGAGPGAGRSGSNPVWRLKADQPMTGWFTGPITNETHGVNWVAYQETYVEKYKINGSIVDAPRGMAALPVNGPDDPLLTYVHLTEREISKQMKDWRDDKGDMRGFRPRVKTPVKVLVQFIMERQSATGEVEHRPILLSLSSTGGSELKTYYESLNAEMGGTFDITGKQYTLSKTGTGLKTKVVITPNHGTPPADIDPEAQIDILGYLNDTKTRIRNFLVNSSGPLSFDNHVDSPAEDQPPWSVAEEAAEVISEADDTADEEPEVPGEPGGNLLDLNTAQLKDLLVENGIDLPTRAGRPTLIKVAQAHGLG